MPFQLRLIKYHWENCGYFKHIVYISLFPSVTQRQGIWVSSPVLFLCYTIRYYLLLPFLPFPDIKRILWNSIRNNINKERDRTARKLALMQTKLWTYQCMKCVKLSEAYEWQTNLIKLYAPKKESPKKIKQKTDKETILKIALSKDRTGFIKTRDSKIHRI